MLNIEDELNDLRNRVSDLESGCSLCANCALLNRELQQSRDECESLKRQRDFWQERANVADGLLAKWGEK